LPNETSLTTWKDKIAERDSPKNLENKTERGFPQNLEIKFTAGQPKKQGKTGRKGTRMKKSCELTQRTGCSPEKRKKGDNNALPPTPPDARPQCHDAGRG
jgi:hypothetical protein